MGEIVVRDRMLGRVLAILPAVVIALCVRVLTLGSPPAFARAAAAAVVAGAAWSAYRILTANVKVTAEEVHVRGILYDARVPLTEVQTVSLVAAPLFVRALMWGVVQPRAVRLATAHKALRPLALLSVADDDEVERAMRALMIHCGTRIVPAQRESEDTHSPSRS